MAANLGYFTVPLSDSINRGAAIQTLRPFCKHCSLGFNSLGHQGALNDGSLRKQLGRKFGLCSELEDRGNKHKRPSFPQPTKTDAHVFPAHGYMTSNRALQFPHWKQVPVLPRVPLLPLGPDSCPLVSNLSPLCYFPEPPDSSAG